MQLDRLNHMGIVEPASPVPLVLPPRRESPSPEKRSESDTEFLLDELSLSLRDSGPLADSITTFSPKALPEKPKDARYASLDVVRGMACLMLLSYHTAFYADHSWITSNPSTWTWGGLAINLIGRLWVGVPMFFVVSGYCIAASIDSLRRKPQSLAQYFWRRMRRIYPPLWAAFLFVIVFTALIGLNAKLFASCLQLPRMAEFTGIDWISNFTATSSWLPRILSCEGRYLLSNTWTLCYEEQFYAVTGLLLVLASRRFFATVYAVAGITLVVRHVGRYFDWPIDGLFIDGHWLIFAAGILLYHRVNYLRGVQGRLAFVALACGGAYGLSERLIAADPHDRHVGEYILVASAFTWTMIAAKPWDSRIVGSWLAKPFLWCGKFSYSIYLTHFPITVTIACFLSALGIHADGWVFLITLPTCFAISLPVAWGFYMLVERHFTNVAAR